MNRQTPKWPLRLLRLFCDPYIVDDVEGDLIERYQRKYIHRKYPNWLLTRDVVMLFRPGIIRSLKGHQKLNFYDMMTNHIKIAFRSFGREKVFTAINILGLTLGISSTLITALWAQDEWKFDRFHTMEDQLYRLLINFEWSGELLTDEGTAYPTGDTFVEEFPEVLDRTRFSTAEKQLFSINEQLVEQELAGADANFFELFSYPIIAGNRATCLDQTRKIAISQKMASRFYPDGGAVGQTIELRYQDLKIPFTVTAIFDIPHHSSVQFDALIPLEDILAFSSGYQNWGNTFFNTYLKVEPTAQISSLEKKMNKLISEKDGVWYTMMMQKYVDQHLYSDFENGEVDGGVIDSIRMFSLAALCTLLIACFNYINLTTAKALKRSKEVGLRKVIGATRSNLFGQFITESGMIVVASALLALIVCQLSLPFFNIVLDKQIAIDFYDWPIYSLLVGLVLVITILSGIYPASMLASFNPFHSLKKTLPGSSGRQVARKVLVGFQFSISIILISASWVIYQQIEYFSEKDLGFDKEQVVYLELNEETGRNYKAIKSTLLNHSAVQSVSSSSHDFVGPGIGFTGDVDWRLKKEENQIFIGIHHVDDGLPELLNMKFVNGQGFTSELISDSTQQFLINETAAKALGFENPLGETLAFWGMKGEIVGVLKDFNFATLHSAIQPIILMTSQQAEFVFVKSHPGRLKETVSHLVEVHESFSDLPVKVHFLDRRIEESYDGEATTQKLISISSPLATIISLMGLFGLATYACQRRIKEIGIRKVLGSSVGQLIILFSKEFTTIVGIAIMIGTPIAYFTMQSWLDNYAYRIDLKWWPFALVGLLAVILALLTVGSQTYRAASANPASALRDE